MQINYDFFFSPDLFSYYFVALKVLGTYNMKILFFDYQWKWSVNLDSSIKIQFYYFYQINIFWKSLRNLI